MHQRYKDTSTDTIPRAQDTQAQDAIDMQEIQDTRDMRIAVVGTGYVGLISSVCFASFGYTVIGVDVRKSVVDMLNDGKASIFEPDVAEILQECITKGTLHYTVDYEELKKIDIVFVCVGTPPLPNGQADLTQVYAVLDSLFSVLARGCLIVVRSTIPLGTMKILKDYVAEKKRDDLILCFNPEFLREGSAVHDFFNPDRIVISSESASARRILKQLYAPIMKHAKISPAFIVCPQFATAELAKYATNAFLATKISFINQLALLAKSGGANIAQIVEILGNDYRINPHFFKPGPGFGGSCFPKDTRALVHQGHTYGVKMDVVKEAIESNLSHMKEIASRCIAMCNRAPIHDFRIAIWGLAFKANTDDVRESPALYIIREFINQGILLQAYDPKAMDNFKAYFPEEQVHYAHSALDACRNADLLVVLTEWQEFAAVSPIDVKRAMRRTHVFDFRMILDYDAYRAQQIPVDTL